MFGLSEGLGFTLFMLIGSICCFYKGRESKKLHPNDDEKAFGKFAEYKVFNFFGIVSILCVILLYFVYE